jgi:hypothetical protein
LLLDPQAKVELGGILTGPAIFGEGIGQLLFPLPLISASSPGSPIQVVIYETPTDGGSWLPICTPIFLDLYAGAADPGDSVLSGGSLTGSSPAGVPSGLTLMVKDAWGNPVAVDASEVEVQLMPL